MAEKSNKTVKNQKQTPVMRTVFLFLIVLAVLAALGIAALMGAKHLLFTGNNRFVLRNFELKSKAAGYWSGKSEELARRLGLRLGEDNLFDLNPGEIRRKILAIPTVESCEISRIMPDTLVVNLIERIPRASLYNPRSEFVIDADGMVINRFEAMQIPTMLPVFSGFKSEQQPEAGKKFEAALPALALLMSTIRNYPDISVIYVNMARPDKLEFSMRYRNQKLYRVTIPADSAKIGYLLSMLQSAIISAQRNGDERSTLDLSFDGSVILR